MDCDYAVQPRTKNIFSPREMIRKSIADRDWTLVGGRAQSKEENNWLSLQAEDF